MKKISLQVILIWFLIMVTGLFLPFSSTVFAGEINPDNMDDYIRMNQLQSIGTHNSYHIAPDPKLISRLSFFASEVKTWDYTHLPLQEQFQKQNIRQVELDIYADPEGGLFADRAGNVLIFEDRFADKPQLYEPGFKLLHAPHIDYETHHLTFVEALEACRDWSLENSNHLPVMILVEVKGGIPEDELNWFLRFLITLADFFLGLFWEPISLPVCAGKEDLGDLEAEILSVFDESHIITPDEVRGDHKTLEEAVLNDGWPTLAEGRGRVYFTLDNECEVRDLYLEGNPSLKNRLLFVSSPPGEPSAAFIKMNEPRDDNEELIREYVRSGYIIRTRSDSGLEFDAGRLEAALNSGAHFISTDLPAPGEEDYAVSLPGTAEGFPARCNPVNGIPDCNEEILHNLE